MLEILKKLNQLWRIVVTAFGFSLFGAGGLLLLSLLWFNLIRLLVKNKNERNKLAQQSISICFRFFLWVMKFLRVIDYQFHGLDKLKEDKSCLIVANHPSLLDVVFLVSVMPRCDCMVKNSLKKNIFIGSIIKTAGYIINTDADKMLPYCSEILSSGGKILIFPEGTRSQPGEDIVLQRGAANIALRCRADIRIIHIECIPPMLTKQQKWYLVPSRKSLFNITVGEKIAINDFTKDNVTVSARRLTRYLTSKLSKKSN